MVADNLYMVSKRRQIVERPSGIGKIFKDEQEIATASYLLDVGQTINSSRTGTATIETPGVRDVGGRIKVLDGQTDLKGGKFILELTDGRRWEFLTTKGDAATGSYAVAMSPEAL